MTVNEQKQCTATTDKAQIRRIMLGLRARIEGRADKQSAVTARLLERTAACDTVFCYVSMGSEIDTHAYLRQAVRRQTVTVPFTENGRIQAVTPINLNAFTPDKLGNVAGRPYAGEIGIAVVPLVAFNADLYRIGYGKGCYDRWLAEHRVPTVGLAFDEQEADFCPQSHDIPLDCIITPTRILCRKKND